MAVWRVLLRLSTSLNDLGEAQAIDATGFERHTASRHYANRVDYHFQAVKTTALVDCETTATLDIDVGTLRSTVDGYARVVSAQTY